MFKILQIIFRLLRHPFTYGVLDLSTETMTVVACGKHQELEDFQKLIVKRHMQHLATQNL